MLKKAYFILNLDIMKQLAFLIIFLWSTTLYSAHIIGGVAHYNFVTTNAASGTTTLEINFKLYRDENSGGAALDNNANFGIFEKKEDGTYELFLVAERISPENIKIENFQIGGIVYSVQWGTYSFNVTFEHDKDYIISYMRCCKGQDVQNIFNPGETGMAVQIEILKEALVRSVDSPEILNVPFSSEELNTSVSYPLDFIKPDNTDIDFSFVAPKESGGTFDAALGNLGCCECVRPHPIECSPPYDDVVFLSGFTSDKPFGILNPVVIDDETGELTGTFTVSGRYNYGIEITHSLNGEILSRQILDYTLVIIGTTSTKDITLGNNITLLPNPTDGILHIKYDSNQSDKAFKFWVYKLNGEILKIILLKDQSNRINLDVPSGVYLIKSYQENKLLGIDRIVVN